MGDLAELYRHLSPRDEKDSANAEFCAVLLDAFLKLQDYLDDPPTDGVPLRSIVSTDAVDAISPKPGPQVQAILRPNIADLERLVGRDRWEAMHWPQRLEEAFASGCAVHVSSLLQQLADVLATIAQEGRPEW